MLLNYLPTHFLGYYRKLAREVGNMVFLLSESMDRSRGWRPDHEGLTVRIQKTISFRARTRHPLGFDYSGRLLIPISTIADLWQLKPDVVVTLEIGPRTLQAIALKLMGMRFRLVIQVRESLNTARSRGWFRRLIRRFALPRADCVLVNGRSGREYVESCGVHANRIAVVTSGTDFSRFGHVLRKEGSTGCLRIIYVGALIKLKGIVDFAACLARECSDAPITVEWTIVGRGEEKRSLEEIKWPRNLRVSILEFVEYADLAAVYSDHDVLVMPSLCDEWGMVVNEAMATGLPVLGCTGAQAVEEMVVDGESGWTYPPGDFSAMRQAVRAMLAADRASLARMGTRAREVAGTFSDGKAVEQMLGVIESLNRGR